MASLSLAEARKLIREPLQRGVVKSIITVDKFFTQLPFVRAQGERYFFNRELTESGAGFLAVGGTVNATQATVTQIAVTLKRIIGDVNVDRLEQLTMSRDNDQLETQIALKAKKLGRVFKDALINGNSSTNANQFDGLDVLTTSGQTVSGGGTSGQAISFALLDDLLEKVTSRDGDVDFLAANNRTRDSIRALLRAQGGSTGVEVVRDQFGNALTDLAYRSIPVYRNDNISIAITENGVGKKTRLYAGNLGDEGIVGLMPPNVDAFVQIEPIGAHQTRDETIVRVRLITAVALHSDKALARLSNIND